MSLINLVEIVEMSEPVVTVLKPRRVQLRPCPTCGDDMPGLLGTCPKPDCVSADIAFTSAYERSCDR
jgi:hypothetical protein